MASVQVTFERAGVLAPDRTFEEFQSIKQSIDIGVVDVAHVEQLQMLISAASVDDPDLAIVQLSCAQAHLVLFKQSGASVSGQGAVRLARDVRDAESIPKFLRLYERGRVAYEVGRRVGSPVLLEESVHCYRAARKLQPVWSEIYRRIGSQLKEAKSISESIAVAAYGPPRSLRSMLNFTIESVPVEDDCWREKNAFWKKRSSIAPFGARVLGQWALITFERSPQRSPRWMAGGVDTRGRELSGLIAGAQALDDSRVNAFRLVQSHDGNPHAIRDKVDGGGRELYLWCERVNRWCDILSQKVPEEGVWHRQKFIYGSLYGEKERFELIVNADEPGVTHQFSFDDYYRLSRFDLSFILNVLSNCGVPVSLELMRQAQHSLLLDEPRRAVIEAGTAAESALAVLYDSHEDAGARDARWALGRLAREVGNLKDGLPDGETQATVEQALVKPRNDAVHRAIVTRKVATEAVETALRIVDYLFAFKDNDVVTLAARLETLSPWLDEYREPSGGFDNTL